MKNEISKLGSCATSDENWKLLQEILTDLYEKFELKVELLKSKKK